MQVKACDECGQAPAETYQCNGVVLRDGVLQGTKIDLCKDHAPRKNTLRPFNCQHIEFKYPDQKTVVDIDVLVELRYRIWSLAYNRVQYKEDDKKFSDALDTLDTLLKSERLPVKPREYDGYDVGTDVPMETDLPRG